MFGIGENKPAKIKTSVAGIDSIVSQGTTVNGPMTFKGGFKVAGEVLGKVTGGMSEKSGSDNSVVVESTGKIQGDVVCDNVIIAGAVFGNITAKSVYLAATAYVIGRVAYEVLQVEPGARVSGDMKFSSPSTKNEEQPLQEAA